jgi:PAS domain S-box-containing protein
MATNHPHGFRLIVERSDGELVIEWISAREADRLGISSDSVPIELRSLAPLTYAEWHAAFRDALTCTSINRVIADTVVTFVAVGGARAIAEIGAVDRTANASSEGEATPALPLRDTDLSREQVSLAMRVCDVAVWTLDLSTGRFDFDGAWFDRLGYQYRIDSIAWWRDKVHPEDLDRLQNVFDLHIGGRNSVFHTECRVQTARGEWLWVMSTGRITARSHDGRPSQVVGICIDMTDRRRIEEQLVVTEGLAALGMLAASIGHEINNPLTYVLLALELIDRGLGRAPVEHLRETVSKAFEGAERIRATVQNLRALSRPLDENITTIDPVSVLARALDVTYHELRNRARVERQLSAAPPIRADEGRLLQLFVNLIAHAAYAVRERDAESGLIRITSGTTSDGRALFEVCDNGEGFAPDVLPHIFDLFATRRSPAAGTGLGLAIAARIVKDLAGEIEVQNTSGASTTFRVTFSAARSDMALPDRSPAAPAVLGTPETARSLRVLVVDDDHGVATTIARALDIHDATAETSARSALTRIEAGERFDAIVCDLMMPDIDGIAFYERLIAIDSSLAKNVVFITGGAFTRRATEFFERVPNARMMKPLDIDALLATLEQITARAGVIRR